MLTNPDSKHGEGDVVEEKGNLMQGQLEQLLKSTAAEHDCHRRAQADIIIHGDDHGMTRLSVKKVD
jgi:hypothetical protein